MNEQCIPTNNQVLSEQQLREIVLTRLQSMFLDRPLRENLEIIYVIMKRLECRRNIRLDRYVDKVIEEFDKEKQRKEMSIYPNV